MPICSTLNCSNCKRWGGNRHSKFGDCQHVIGELKPELFELISNNNHRFTLPFDPHDVKYFTNSRLFKLVYSSLRRGKLPAGIRIIQSKEKDAVFNGDDCLRIAIVKLTHIQTAPTYYCGYHKGEK